MSSLRHNGSPAPAEDPDQAYLDVARDTILAVGWRRTTLTEVARRAGVSRMTIYRRWPDMRSLLADLLVREWGGLVDAALTSPPDQREGLAGGLVATAASLRRNDLFRKIVAVDPELLLPYLLERRGRNQDHLLTVLSAAIGAGQRAGVVRPGDPELLSRALLLAVQGFAISTGTMPETPAVDLDRELEAMLTRYLAP